MNSFRISRCHLSHKTPPAAISWRGRCSASRVQSSPKHNSPNDELVQVGIIGGPHGLKGEVRVQPTSDFEEERLGPPGPKYIDHFNRNLTLFQNPPSTNRILDPTTVASVNPTGVAWWSTS